jgi:hypothetical protein
MSHPAGILAPAAPFGYWTPPGPGMLPDSPEDFHSALADLRSPVAIVCTDHGFAIARGGSIAMNVDSGGLRPPLAKSTSRFLPRGLT